MIMAIMIGIIIEMRERRSVDTTMYPTIIRRVTDDGAIETINRKDDDGRSALCIFWSLEHARQAMEECGLSADWRAVERDHEQLAMVFELVGVELAYLEPHPEDPELGGVFEPDEFIQMLEKSVPA